MSAVEKELDPRAPERSRRSTLVRLPLFESDAAIVTALRSGQSAGGAALYDRYHPYVRRVLTRLLGPDAALHDLIQDVFLAAIDSIDSLEEPDALRGWLAGICVNAARVEIRRKTRGRWFPLFGRDDLPEVEAPASTPELDEAVGTTYRVLSKLPIDERIPFALRFVEGMELVELADACGISLATAKRRLARARKKFLTIARTYPELADWVEGGKQ
jgi:RNA polymerase sigma-70 factor (ECF subfamily)